MNTVKNLNQTLAFQLEGVYEIVKRLQADLSVASKHITDPEMRTAVASYCRSLADHRLKLKRIFGYLLNGPYDRKQADLRGVIEPWNEIRNWDMLPRLKDVVVGSTLQSFIRYILTSYTEARYIAMRLELDRVVQLLDEILDEEEETYLRLKGLTAAQVNQACLMTTSN